MSFHVQAGLLLTLSFCSLLGSQEPAASPTARWIEQLGRAVFAERAKAEAELGKLASVPPELRRAARSTDPEVRKRAKATILLIESVGKARKRHEIDRLLIEGRLDLALERTVAWQDADISDKWSDGFAALAAELWTIQKKLPGFERFSLKNRDTMSVLEKLRKDRSEFGFVSSDKAISELRAFTVARAPSIKSASFNHLDYFLLTSGDAAVDSRHRSMSFVLFSAGSVRVKQLGVVAIIVADGDVELDGVCILDLLVIARGNVTVEEGMTRSNLTIFAGGKIDLPHDRRFKLKHCILRPNDRTGMGLIKFFETAQVGLETASAPKGVALKAVGKKSIFEGRLLKGDVVTTIDKDATTDPEKFRRVLRRALTNVGNDVAFHVLREGKAVVVAVAIPALPAAK